jgi:DNA-directed RNA polymerase sigma subunit (sigma70/sigma32)
LETRQWRASVSQLPLADVEQQSIETMEQYVRMPSEVFLLNCHRLLLAETKYQQARRQLVLDHLGMVASIAGTCLNRGLTLPVLIREGIFGLIHAVDRFRKQRVGAFPAYATCWIQQNIEDALAAQPRHAHAPDAQPPVNAKAETAPRK